MMKQKFFAMIAAAALLVGMTGCSKDDNSSSIDINAMEKDLIGMWVDEYEYSDVTEDGVPFDKVLLCVGVHEDHTGCIYLGAFNKTSDEPVAFYEAGFKWALTKEGNIVLSDPVTDESTVLTRAVIVGSYGDNMTNVSGTNMTYANGRVILVNVIYAGTLNKADAQIVNYMPLKNAQSSHLGCVVCTEGHIHQPGVNDYCKAEKVAKITYVGNDAETSTTYNHGLALALADANNSNNVLWCSQTDATCLSTQYRNITDAKTDMAGIANTDYMINNVPAGHNHTAASAARNYNGGAHPTGTSAWFLPSVGQWQKMFDAAGNSTDLGWSFSGVGGTDVRTSYYWSSTEVDASHAWDYDFFHDRWDDCYEEIGCRVRPALAF